ncbi:ABC-2 type transporter-domain-containing protein [Hyaloraphidium curvatum]|nr:ABC-2 type transporter-domain-containing protein [Hyaloraphidium curvatum]
MSSPETVGVTGHPADATPSSPDANPAPILSSDAPKASGVSFQPVVEDPPALDPPTGLEVPGASQPADFNAGRRRSSAFRTKSGNLIDGTHIGVFEEQISSAGEGVLEGDSSKKAFDMTAFLEKLRAEDEKAGDVRDVLLTWEGITVKTARSSTQEGIPVFWEPVKRLLSLPWTIAAKVSAKKAAKEAAANGSSPAAPAVDKTVLNDVSGFCRGGEMVLILGKPDSGASSLVRVLGQQGRYFKSCVGKIEMNGVDSVPWMKEYGSELYYSGDEDLHLPSLTVSQTFDYALQYREKDPARRQEWLEWLVTWLGLGKAKDTIVGDSFLRGVSGGERRRVSVGEQLAANATVNCWDQPTKGLDSTYALVVCKGLRLLNSILNKTSVCYLNQVSQQIYELFDSVIVLAEGRVIFQGPGDQAKDYFIGLGFEPLPRQSTSDFIQQCTERKEQNVRPGFTKENGRAPPVTAAEFEAAWKASPEYASFLKDFAEVKQDSAARNAASTFHDAVISHRKATSASSPDSVYQTTRAQQFATTVRREYTLLGGQKFNVVAKWLFNLIIAFVVSSYAFQAPNTGSGAFAKASGIFFSLLINALNTNADIPNVLKGRPVMYKHKNNFFLRPFWFYLATIAADLPVRLANIFTFTVIYYWMVGYQASAAHFFIFFLCQFVAGVAYSAESRFLISLSSNADVAFRLNGLLIIPSIIYSGYFIPYSSVKPWFVWLYWINPLAYAFKAMMVNEFSGQTISCADSFFPPFPNVSAEYKTCTIPGSQPNSTTVSGDDWLWATRQIPTGPGVIWYNFAAIVGLTIVYTLLAAIVTAKVEFGKGGVTTNIFKKGFVPSEAPSAAGTFKSSTIAGTRRSATTQAINAAVQEHEVALELASLNPLRANGVAEDLPAPKPSISLAERVKSAESIAGQLLVKAPTLTFKDLSYFISVGRGKERQLLDSVSGRIVPGALTALMGFTGAGKTTLQDVLARRKTAGRIEGTVLVDNVPQGEDFKRIMAYAEQSDVLNPNFTVRESLRFSAYCRQPADVPKEEKDSYVEQVIDILGMHSIAEALVGSVEKGVGIGLVDRKKLNIGIQLVAKPEVLILDEPTSGQDSFAAFQIVRLLRNLADLGLAIFCTIHQPSALLFEYFDNLILIANGGRAVYVGEIGPEAGAVCGFFARNGATPIADGENPAEYLLDAGNGLRDSGGINTLAWPQIWKESAEYASLMETIDKTVAAAVAPPPDANTREFALTTAQQIPLVVDRMFLDYYRDFGYNFGRIILSIMQGVIVGFTFFQMPNTFNGAVLQMFALFSVTTLGIPYIITPVTPFDERRKYFYRDSASGMYGYLPFSLAITIAELPFAILPSCVFFLIIYWTYGLQMGHLAPLIFLAGLLCFHYWCNSYGQSVAALAPNAELASLLISLSVTLMPAISGVPVPYNVLPNAWLWFYYINPYHYSAGIFITNQLHNLPLTCVPSDLKVFNPPPPLTCGTYLAPVLAQAPGYLLNPGATSGCEYCPIDNGDSFLSYQLGWSWSQMGLFFGVLIALTVVNRLSLVFFMWRNTRRKLAAGKK